MKLDPSPTRRTAPPRRRPLGGWRASTALMAAVLGAATLAGCGAPRSDAGTVAATEIGAGGDAEVVNLPPRRDVNFGATEPYRPANLPNLSLTPPMLYELLAAEIAVQRQQPSTAYNSYMGLAAQTRDARMARRATEIALNGRAFEQALAGARQWAELDPEADEPKQAVEALLLATNRLGEAEPRLKERLATARAQNDVDAFYTQLQRTLTRIEDRKGAWATLQRLSADDLDRLSARRTRAVVAELAGDRKAAAAEALAAHELAPRDAGIAIQAARLVQGLGDDGSTRATALLDAFVRQNPDEGAARLALARVYLADKQSAPARTVLQAALKRQPDDPATLFLAAQAAYQAKDLAAARSHLTHYVGLPPSPERDDASAWVFLGQIAEDEQQIAESIGYLERVDGGDLFLPALSRRATLMARNGDLDGARRLLETTEARTPQERNTLLSAQALILREAGRFQDAFDLLDKALAKDPDNPDLLYDHALAAERLGRIETLEKSLRHLIELQPDNAHAYNALGYTLADRNLRLTEALELIEKALELSPDDAQIIDSLGWVHYRLGNLDEALRHLKRAYDIKPDVEVAAHYGEVLWQSGARDEALKVWREASGREPKNEVLVGTLARLNVSL